MNFSFRNHSNISQQDFYNAIIPATLKTIYDFCIYLLPEYNAPHRLFVSKCAIT